MTTAATLDSPEQPDTIAAMAELEHDERTGLTVFDANRRQAKHTELHRDSLAQVLTTRRLELLPPIGDRSPITAAQGRTPGDSTTLTELADLISSIEHMGVLQPILVEETVTSSGTQRVVVAGERRLRAMRWGHTHRRDNPHFDAIPAVVVTGPLTDEDKRSWQLIENLAREDLKPGELAAALLFERCAILTTRLLSLGIPVPRDISELDSPAERFERLEALRAGNVAAAASWDTVLHRLGLQMSARKARQLVSAFRALPAHLVEEMDDERVALATRIKFVDLRQARQGAVDEIWAAVKETGTPKVLNAALTIAAAHPTLDPDSVVTQAVDMHTAANHSRRDSLTHLQDPGTPGGDTPAGAVDPANPGDFLATVGPDGDGEPGDPQRPAADPALTVNAINALRAFTTHLSATGAEVPRYDRGSLRLLCTTVLDATA